MRKISIALIVLLTSIPFSPAHAANITGTKCVKVGKTQKVKNLTYTCVVVRGKNVWSSGVDLEAKQREAAKLAAEAEAKRLAAEELNKREALLANTIPGFSKLDITSSPGQIRINWSGVGVNNQPMGEYDHVGVYVQDSIGSYSDGTKEISVLDAARAAYLDVPGGNYKIKLIATLKDGSLGRPSNVIDVQVQPKIRIDLPTLPTGFSVSPVKFGLTASWNGSYATQSFFGFSRIEIYASAYDLGASSTDSSYFKGKLVGSMTVNDAPNKITIGLDILRNAFGITGSDVYARSYYFYQVVGNRSNEWYSVDGKITWTRINSQGVSPLS
jgi:hypothetical protein